MACFLFFLRLSGAPSPAQSAKLATVLQAKLLPGAWSGGKMLSDDDYAMEVQTLNQFFASVLALADQRRTPGQDAANIRTAEAQVIDSTLFVRMLIPAERVFLNALRRHEASLRGSLCLVALRRWQLEHEDVPSDLETLIKAAGMKNVPMDPYSLEPLRMGSIAGETVIYSVGPDGQDDKAQVEWNLLPSSPGDFIFRLDIRKDPMPHF